MAFSPDMDDIIKRLVESDKRKSQGLCEAGMDPLIEEFGPEHGGRTRGVENVGFTKGIEGYVQKKKRKREIDESLQAQKAEVIEIVKKFEVEIEAKYDKKIAENEKQIAELKSLLESRQSSCGSTTAANHDSSTGFSNRLDEISESAKCYLFSPYNKDKTPIAWGVVYPTGDGIIHGVPIIPTYMKVTVDKVLPAHKTVKLPVMGGDKSVTLLGQAIGSFFQWPQCRISRMKEITPTSKNKDQRMTTTMPTASVPALQIDLVAENTTSMPIPQQKEALSNAQKAVQKSVAQVVIKETPKPKQAFSSSQKAANIAAQKVAAQEAKELLEKRLTDVGDTIDVRGPLLNAAYLRWMSRDDCTSGYVVDVPAGMFVGQEESFTITVDADDILKMWTNGWLDASIITYFNWGLYKLMQSSSSRCGLLNPYLIQGSECLDNTSGVKDYLTRAFNATYDIFLAPFIEKGNHWVFFVICPKQRIHLGFVSAKEQEKDRAKLLAYKLFE